MRRLPDGGLCTQGRKARIVRVIVSCSRANAGGREHCVVKAHGAKQRASAGFMAPITISCAEMLVAQDTHVCRGGWFSIPLEPSSYPTWVMPMMSSAVDDK